MAYVNQEGNTARTKAIIGVIGIHAIIGYGLVTGLSFEKIAAAIDNPEGIFIPVPKPTPPPPPPADPKPTRTPPSAAPAPYVPPIPAPLATSAPDVSATTIILPPLPPLPVPGTSGTKAGALDNLALPAPAPKATPTGVEPSPVRPRGNPGEWVTNNDYRSSWIAREMEGTVTFQVAIDARGRITQCSILKGSGHSELDAATCANVKRRARFEAARNAQDRAVPSTYSNTVLWRIPE
ncbi:TonB family protein [Altererythrobacter sp. SALINAS58]|uniref:energy transducer TonB n=1 Tax=Alteripontixanthobacter muriae TaxID=2705546 RepID=UPI001574F94B|nr:energy transducer TonB [Alteripontixanthobacter muriae]NTZ42008.1 TonB family protein [Alteripontixanthobacter muriae]